MARRLGCPSRKLRVLLTGQVSCGLEMTAEKSFQALPPSSAATLEAEFHVSPAAKLPCGWVVVPGEASVPVEPQHLVKSRVREGLSAASVPAPRHRPPLRSPGLGPGPPWSPPALRGSLLPDNKAGRA